LKAVTRLRTVISNASWMAFTCTVIHGSVKETFIGMTSRQIANLGSITKQSWWQQERLEASLNPQAAGGYRSTPKWGIQPSGKSMFVQGRCYATRAVNCYGRWPHAALTYQFDGQGFRGPSYRITKQLCNLLNYDLALIFLAFSCGST
jgi:hypothetical protein